MSTSTLTSEYEAAEAQALLDSDLGFNIEPEAAVELRPRTYLPRPKPAAAAVAAQPCHIVAPAPRSRVLPRLLAMADSYFRAGSIRQALDMYFDLAQNHPDTPEALQAEERILDVARVHEENGELHLARAIYEQMI